MLVIFRGFKLTFDACVVAMDDPDEGRRAGQEEDEE